MTEISKLFSTANIHSLAEEVVEEVVTRSRVTAGVCRLTPIYLGVASRARPARGTRTGERIDSIRTAASMHARDARTIINVDLKYRPNSGIRGN
jgi:hypothetical protein